MSQINNTLLQLDNPFQVKLETCRLCLNDGAKTHIFKKATDNSNLVNKIALCCQLQIFENDGLPINICKKCNVKLNLFTKFKLKCEESDRVLRICIPNLFKDDQFDIKFESDFMDDNKKGDIKDENRCTKDDNITVKNELHTILNISENDSESEIKDNTYDNNFSLIVPKDETISNMKPRRCKRGICKIANVKKKIKELNILDFNFKSRKKVIKDIEKKKYNRTNTNIYRQRLEKHGEKEQSDENGLHICSFCGKQFTRDSIARHLKTHTNHRRYLCDICSKGFNSRTNLKMHLLSHNSAKTYVCKLCDKSYKFLSGLISHKKVIHEKTEKVPCLICNKTFTTRATLRAHVKLHTREKEFDCDICDKKFPTKFRLHYHLTLHTGEKPYSCKYCDKMFRAPKSKTEHERLHTGETPYRCPICSKGFMQRGNMKSHFRFNHKGQKME